MSSPKIGAKPLAFNRGCNSRVGSLKPSNAASSERAASWIGRTVSGCRRALRRYPLPTLLNHMAMPGCSKINTHWDRCGVYYVNPIDGRER